MASIRVELPYHLRNLAGVEGHELALEVAEPVTIASAVDALEARFPMLEGTIRDHVTKVRRPFLRFFACGLDLSHEPTDIRLPEGILKREEPLIILGAISGG